MKIWLQSGSGLSADSGTAYGRRYEDAVAQHMAAVARPGTELGTFGIDSTPYGKDRYRAALHIVATRVIASALRAEEQRYDAVAVINTLDHGYDELRELLDIPVVFITESAMHLACQLAPVSRSSRTTRRSRLMSPIWPSATGWRVGWCRASISASPMRIFPSSMTIPRLFWRASRLPPGR